MKILVKLYILTVCSLVLVLLTAGTLWLTTRHVNRALADSQMADEAIRGLFELGIVTTDYLLHHSDRAREQWERKHAALGGLLRELRSRAADDRAAVARLQDQYREVGDIFAALVRQQAGNHGEVPLALRQRYVAQLNTRTQAMVAEATEFGRRNSDRVAVGRRRAMAMTGLAVALVAGFMVFASVMFDRSVVQPIHRLHVGTEIIGSGRLDHKVGQPTQDEIGQLSRAFDEMTARLQAVTVSRDELAGEIELRKRLEAELQRAKEAAEAASKAKSQFLASMSHELRTPLNSVIGFANLLLKDKSGRLAPDERLFLERILANGKHLLYLINQVLDLAKIEARKVEVTREPVALAALVRDTVAEFVAQARGGPVELRTELPATLAPVTTDAGKLKQVLINLVGNALKFTARGHVTVRVEADPVTGQPVRLAVVDTGPGIPADRLRTIFEPFTQADAGVARKYGGSGLGLTVSQSLCQLLGYRLEVQSEPGRGSTFSVWFGPVPAAPPPRAVLPVAPPPVAPGERKLVLVVDDEMDSRLLLAHVVEECGCRVMTADSGAQALREARGLRPDLILLDLMMPEMDGWQVLKAMKADAVLRDIPVVVVSVAAGEQRGVVLGALDVLQKPLEREQLQRVLAAHARRQVLVVEDNPDDRRLLGAILQQEGMAWREAGNGRAALAVLEEFQPDLILLDLMMPEVDGLTFLQRLRADARFAGVTVVVVTAKELAAQEAAQLRQLAQEVVPKAGELATQLHALLAGLRPPPERTHG